MEDLYKNLFTLLAGVIGAVTPTTIAVVKKKLSKNSFAKNNKHNELLNDELLRIMIYSGADMVGTLFFKNTEYSMGGFPLDKAFMGHEVTAPRVNGVMNDLQGIPTTPLAKMLNKLQADTNGWIGYNRDVADSNLRDLMDKHGIGSAIVFRINNDVKNGIVILQWRSGDFNNIMLEKQLREIRVNVLRINDLISKIRK